MSDEKPLQTRRVEQCSSVGSKVCIIHYNVKTDPDITITDLTDVSFGTILNCASVRQGQSLASQRLDSICQAIPHEFDELKHGYHRKCYQRFTNIKRFSQKKDENETSISVPAKDSVPEKASSRISGRSTARNPISSLLFPKTCIFCGLERRSIKGSTRKENLATCVTKEAESRIKEVAILSQNYDIIAKVEGVDLIAREAKYHESCRGKFIRPFSHSAKKDTESKDPLFGERRAAHDAAFLYLSRYVQKHIIGEGNVLRMTMLRDKYNAYMEENFPSFHNRDYPTQRVKEKLTAHFGDRINFQQTKNNKSDLVFGSDLNAGEVIEVAFEAATSESRILKNAALILRNRIMGSQLQSSDLPWPPSANDFNSGFVQQPNELKQFLSFLITGKKIEKASDKSERLIQSFSEDICSASTNGRWKMPKHMMLGMTLRHLTGSAEVITLINRFGHCDSYPQVMEFETAVCNQIQMRKSVLPSNVHEANNLVSHFCWDNFDINEQTSSGQGTTHSTHGIVIQEVDTSIEPMIVEESIPKTKERSVKFVESQLPSWLLLETNRAAQYRIFWRCRSGRSFFK